MRTPISTIALIVILISLSMNTVGYGQTKQSEWPKRIVAEVGKLKIGFPKDNMYTIDEISYNGNVINGAGFSGTVIWFEDQGIIGSGHVDKGCEQVKSLNVVVDGREIPLNGTTKEINVSGEIVEVVKESTINDFTVWNKTVIKDSQIREFSKLKADKRHKLKLIYNFMHSWHQDFSQYLARNTKGDILEGEFAGTGGFPVRTRLVWTVFYNKLKNLAVITKVLASSPESGDQIHIWDRKTNNKFYYCSFWRQEFPENVTANYEAITLFKKLKSSNRKEEIQKTVETLK